MGVFRPALLVLLVGCALVSCGASRGSFAGGVYRKGDVAFRVPSPPASWNRIDDIAGAALAFRDDAHHASISVNARCNERGTDVPLAALRNHLLAGTTEREIEREETLPLDSREALRTKLSAKLDGVKMAYEVYVLKKDNCIYDFVYVAPPDKSEGGMSAFDGFVRGFATLGSGS